MTIEFGKILSDFALLLRDWMARTIASESELFEEIEKLHKRLTEELPKQEIPVIDKDKEN